MANLTQTAANVAIGGSNARTSEPLQAGEPLTQGQPAYKKASDRKWYRADANVSAEAAGSVEPPVIVLTPAAAIDDWFVGVRRGPVKLGATLAVGTPYVISATVGAICPYADLVTGDYVTFLGFATSTSVLDLDVDATGVQKP